MFGLLDALKKELAVGALFFSAPPKLMSAWFQNSQNVEVRYSTAGSNERNLENIYMAYVRFTRALERKLQISLTSSLDGSCHSGCTGIITRFVEQ